MKKFLTGIFSLALTVALAAMPLHADVMAKKDAGGHPKKAAISMKAQKAESNGKKRHGKGLDRVRKKSNFGLRSYQSNAAVTHNPTRRVRANAAGEFPEIYGTLSYSDSPSFEYGLYSVPTTANGSFSKIFSLIPTYEGEAEGLEAGYGGAVKDGVYYLNYLYDFYGMIEWYESYGFDMATGRQVYYADLSYDPSFLCYGGMANDPLTNEIYGMCFTDDNFESLSLAKISYATNPPVREVIHTYDDDQWFIAFAIDGKGQFYGVMEEASGEGVLYKIDRTNGSLTRVGGTGQYPYYLSGACIDPKTNRMFWCVNPSNDTGYLTEVNLSTGLASLVCDFTYNEEVTGIFVPMNVKAGAPGECVDIAANFTADSLEGTVSLKAPSSTFEGSSLSGNVTVYLLVNGEDSGSKQAAPGATVSFPVTVPSGGLYSFSVYASNAAGDGPTSTLTNVFVGADSPAATTATAEYADGFMTIKWVAVSEGINGGYLNPETLSYTIKNDRGETIAWNLKGTSHSFPLDEPQNITSYYYDVYVVSGNLYSAPARTNTVVLGGLIPPYTANFATDLNQWTIIDGNNDGKVWTLYSSDGSTMRMTYNDYKDMDDWLISPPLKMEAGKAYNVSFATKAGSMLSPERMEVKWGTGNTAAAMTNTLFSSFSVSDSYRTYAKTIIPEKDGYYYIGFHGISSADSHYLYIKDIKIDGAQNAGAPGLPTSLSAKPLRSGTDWSTTVSFKAPATTIGGDNLTSLTKVDLLRGETIINSWSNPSPGASLTFTDQNPGEGSVTYSVIGTNAQGTGLTATTTINIGLEEPRSPQNVTAQRTNVDGQVLLTWSPVTQDANGQPLNPGEVTYTIYKDYTRIAENITATTYSVQAVEPGEQDFFEFKVAAANSEGQSETTSSGMIAVGTPFNGLDETFAGKTLHYPWVIWNIGYVSAGLYTDEDMEGVTSVTGDGGYLYMYSPYADNGGGWVSGLVALNQIENPGLTFYIYNINTGNDDLNEISVDVMESTSTEWVQVMQPASVAELCGSATNTWSKVTVPLGAYANKTIQFRIMGITKAYAYTLFDDIKVASILGHDLSAAAISAPSTVKAGAEYTVQATVSNDGAQAASSFSVELYADNNLVATQTGATLESGAMATFDFNLTMPAIATKAITYYAKVVYAQDENPANNQSATTTVTPIVSNLPKATGLEGEYTETGAIISWNEPNIEGGVAEEITDDFEDADGITAQYGDWTFYDGDQATVGGFQGVDIPGITPGETKGSFWVWDNDLIGGNSYFDAHSGSHYLFALFRYDDGTTDDWAISPELYGGSQTISFYAKSYSSQYPEKLAVYYSTGSKNTSDFILVKGSQVDRVPGDWTQYTVQLPDGAKYFAIRSYASSSFMLMIDDVTYCPVGTVSDIEIAGYNIYRDGEKLNDTLLEETVFVDTTAEKGETYTYVVTAVYTDRGESGPSDPLIFKNSGVTDALADEASISVENKTIVVRCAEDLNVNVATPAGTAVFFGKGNARIEVATGVYIVKAGNTIRKVLVK